MKVITEYYGIEKTRKRYNAQVIRSSDRRQHDRREFQLPVVCERRVIPDQRMITERRSFLQDFRGIIQVIGTMN